MTLFEQLKLFPKLDLHVDFFGSIPKETIVNLTSNLDLQIEDVIDYTSLTNYDNYKEIVAKTLKTLDLIEIAAKDLIEKLENDNIIYTEIFLNLDLFNKNLNKRDIMLVLLKTLKNSHLKINFVLQISSLLTKEELYDDLNILYEFYNKGINGVYFSKTKQDNLDNYQALFDKFIKDQIPYIVCLDSKLTNQNKEIYYNASRIIYDIMEVPLNNFLNIIKDNNIILEIPITYQSSYNIYDSLENHFIYDIYKENVGITFTTIDMTILDTNMLNEYCLMFNVFPFNLHDLINISLNNLNKLNIDSEIKNDLITEYKEKANELL